MVSNNKIKVGIIGAGRVGTTIAYVLAKKNSPNIKVSVVASRSKSSLDRAKEVLSGVLDNIYFI